MPQLLHRIHFTLTITLLVSLLSLTAQADAAPPVRILMIGDSTMATYNNPPNDRPDMTGWGQIFGEYFTDDATITNHAASGRSSSSFIKEGRWKKALAEKPDYLFIQFGHNDCPGKGDRETDPATTFQQYLNQYINEARAANIKPILVTPMTRRRFQNGQIWTILRPYADAMLKVGKEQNVPVIDLHKKVWRCSINWETQAALTSAPANPIAPTSHAKEQSKSHGWLQKKFRRRFPN